jgi:PAS domain-containing protein
LPRPSKSRLGSWQWDIAANKISWSDELYRIYGLEPNTGITYEDYLALIHPDDRDHAAGVVTTTYQSGQPFDFEHRVIRPDGVVRTLHAQGRVILDETGRPIKMVYRPRHHRTRNGGPTPTLEAGWNNGLASARLNWKRPIKNWPQDR